MNDQSPVVLFDGECNLCSRLVNFLLNADRKEVFRFASLQSDPARSMLGDRLDNDPIDSDTVVLLEDDRIFLRSDAVLRIASLLPWPWRAGRVLILVPKPLREAAYRLVARNRKRVFRKQVTCRLPTADERRRLL